jgi:hypothetical protein
MPENRHSGSQNKKQFSTKSEKVNSKLTQLVGIILSSQGEARQQGGVK